MISNKLKIGKIDVLFDLVFADCNYISVYDELSTELIKTIKLESKWYKFKFLSDDNWVVYSAGNCIPKYYNLNGNLRKTIKFINYNSSFKMLINKNDNIIFY